MELCLPANNQPEPVDGFSYPGYYLPEDRAKRITQLLEPKSNWDKAAVGQMIYDNTSLRSRSSKTINFEPFATSTIQQ
jgi:hypothetical protein